MTNFNTATKSFTLHAEGTESYAWAWEGINRQQALKEITETGNDIIAYAHGWACELCNNCIDQIKPEGECGFTAEEITHDLIVDRHALADALQAWLEGDDEDPEDDQDEDDEDEPLFVITHPMMGDWSDPATISEISADVAMNWRTAGVEYRVEAHGDNVYIYAMDSSSESNSRNWHGWLYLGFGEYRLEIGELYQPEEEGDDQEDEYASDEAYLGESTLAKVRRQKVLLLEDRGEMFPSRHTPVSPVSPQTREGFFICTRSVEGGGTPGTIIYAFADEGDFIAQNPHWEGVELPAPRWHGVAVMDTTQPVEGGFQLAWGGWHDAPIHAPYIYKP